MMGSAVMSHLLVNPASNIKAMLGSIQWKEREIMYWYLVPSIWYLVSWRW